MRTRRAAVALVAASLVAALLAACGSSESSTRAGSSSPSANDPGTTTIVVGPDGSSTVLSESGGGVDPTTTEGAASSSSAPSGADMLDGTGPPGSYAPDLLLPSRSSGIFVAVSVQPSAEPQQEAIDHVVSVLRDVSGKPVEATDGPPLGGTAHDWSADELRALSPPSVSPAGARAMIHLLFVHGTFGGDKSVLGSALRGDLAAIFIDRVNASATPLVGSSGIETAVVAHEVGHLLGLVDLHLHTGRQDPEHPGHSTNTHSVMYWAVESDLVADLLQGGPPREFDDADRADLTSIRNGG